VIRLVFFAKLREDLGAAGESLDLPPGVATVEALRGLLVARGGARATALAPGRAVRVAVNHEVAEAATPVREGDEVAFFPPVTGG
jgi:molybdopterin synthase sulfur carrier subunit